MKRFFVLLLLFISLIGAYVWKRPTIETSLFALVGEGEIKMPSEVLARGSGEIQVLFFAEMMEEALPIAETFYDRLDKAPYQQIRFKLDENASQQILDTYQQHATGLLSPKDEALLMAGDYTRLRKQATRKWHTSLCPLYSIEEDPFFFLNTFVTSRPLSVSGWQAELNGVFSTETEDGIALLLSLSLKEELATHPDALIPVVNQLHMLARTLQTDAVEISLSGVPLHTVEVAGQCKTEMMWLAIFSIVVICAVAWMALKSFRVYTYLSYVLLFAGGVGALTTLLLLSSIHLLAGVFATTLLGLTIDYAFHGLLARDPQHVRKNLFWSWCTTEISFLPLLFSGLPILMQSAIFMMSGLTAAWLGVRATLNVTLEAPVSQPQTKPTRLRFLPLCAFLLLLPCMAFLSFKTDLQAFHEPSEQLRLAEKRFHDLTFAEGDATTKGLLVVEGETLEDLLAREAKVQLPEGTVRPSNFLPPYERRLAIYRALQRFYATEGDRFCASFGLTSLRELSPPEPWTKECVPSLFFNSFFVPRETGGLLTILPTAAPLGPLGEGVAFYRPQEEMQRLVDQLTHRTLWLLAIVGGILLCILALLYRQRAWKIALPSLLAVGTVFIAFGTGGRTLNVFHLFASFMLIGMSLDYTIFFASHARLAIKPVTCSFLTSLAGFGALSLVSFMVVQSMGEVFAVGLTVAYVSGMFLFWGEAPSDEKTKGTEVAASSLGLKAIFCLYRCLGKGTLDFAGWMIAHTLWVFSPKVRAFTKSRRRLMAFVQAMIDKFVVMSQGKGAPTIEISSDPETQACIADVRAKKGVFFLSSHFGAIEVLPAISSESIVLHAFMKINQTAVFNAFYFSHSKRPSVILHATEVFGMGEFFLAEDALARGECVLMAGDRALGGSSKSSRSQKEVPFLGRRMVLPVGVFRFAALLEHPIYLVVCYRVSRGVYRFEARRMVADEALPEAFVSALEPFVKAAPEQWYHWEMLA